MLNIDDLMSDINIFNSLKLGLFQSFENLPLSLNFHSYIQSYLHQ